MSEYISLFQRIRRLNGAINSRSWHNRLLAREVDKETKAIAELIEIRRLAIDKANKMSQEIADSRKGKSFTYIDDVSEVTPEMWAMAMVAVDADEETG